MKNYFSILTFHSLFVFYFDFAFAAYDKKYGNAGLYLNDYNCVLDSRITPENFRSFETEITSIWGSICGVDRGIFVLNPSDGQTYNCGKWPEKWNVTLQTLFTAPPEIARNALDQYVQAIYNTSLYEEPDCDFNSLTEFICGREEPWRTAPWFDKIKAPIRAVNIGGLFVLERWIVPDLIPWGNETGIIDQYTFSEKCDELGICDIVRNHWETFYTQDDFNLMKALGLNSIRFPVGHWYFTELSKFPNAPYIIPEVSILDEQHPITKIISYAKNAGLQVILDLHTAPGSQNGFDNSGQATNETQPDNWGETWIYNPDNIKGTIATCGAIATYINHIEKEFGLDNIMIFELLNEPWEDIDLSLIKKFYVEALEVVRTIRPSIPILLHDSFRGLSWGTLLKDWPYENVFLDTHSYQCFNLQDLASDSPKGDRLKIYAHEMEACSNKIPLHYETCNAVPVFVGEFSLAVDDCMPYLNARFEDVGQCNHLAERTSSSYWKTHTTSFAMRQIYTFERELGWSFWAWKLSDYAEQNNPPSSWYWSFRLAAEKGFIDLLNVPLLDTACLYFPVDDYAIAGDGVNGADDGDMDDKTLLAGSIVTDDSVDDDVDDSSKPENATLLSTNDITGIERNGFTVSLGTTVFIALFSFILGAAVPYFVYIREKNKSNIKNIYNIAPPSELNHIYNRQESYTSIEINEF